MDAIVNEGVTPTIRQTVEAVGPGEELSETQLARRLKLAKSTVHYRVRQAIRGGWLGNLETRRSYPARLVPGDPLPQDRSALPQAEEVAEAFELQKSHSNEDSNTPEAHGAEGLGGDSFERSNENQGAAGEGAIDLYPDEAGGPDDAWRHKR